MQHTERILGSARLSHSTEESVSIESQAEDIRAVARYRNATVVHIAVDDGVSGGLSPFARGGLGEWLAEPLLSTWDTLAVAKLDRLTRSLLDFAGLIRWAEDHGKNIVSRAENIDLSTPAGRMMAQIIILFAEFERGRMAERQMANKEHRRQNGAWGSGRAPFGYSKVRRGSLLYLAPHPVHADLWRQGADKLSAGITATAVGRWLGEATGMTWDASRVTRCYRSPVYRGYVTRQVPAGKDDSGKLVHKRHGAEIVTDADGREVTHDAPLITDEKWRELQAALDRGAVLRQNPAAVRELSGVVMCAECGDVLSYQQQSRESGSRYRHYGRSPETRKCRKGGMATLDAAVIEEEFRAQFLRVHGDRKMVRKVVEGEDLSHAIHELEDRRAEVEEQIATGSLPASSGTRIIVRIEHDLTDLRARHGQNVTYVELDITLAGEWERFTPAERNRFLRQRDVTVLVRKGDVRRRPWVYVEHGTLPTLEGLQRETDLGAGTVVA
jgi:DNA invertase Pin-like site-specific DNA recombinase